MEKIFFFMMLPTNIEQVGVCIAHLKA